MAFSPSELRVHHHTPSLNVVITPRRQPVPFCRHPLVRPPPMLLNAMQPVLPPRDVGVSLGRSLSLVCHWFLRFLRMSGASPCCSVCFVSLSVSSFVLASPVHHSCCCCLLSALGSMDHLAQNREIHLLFLIFHTKTEIVDFTQHISVPSRFSSSPFHLCVQTLIPATVRFTQARSPCRS